MTVNIQVNSDALSLLTLAFQMKRRKGEVKPHVWFCILLGQLVSCEEHVPDYFNNVTITISC